jgi:hypothetical protein
MRPDTPDLPERPAACRGVQDPGVEPAEDAALHDAEATAAQVECDVRQRLWLRAVIPLLQLRSHEPDPSCRVQFAFDRMYISACERVARILRSDQGDGPG